VKRAWIALALLSASWLLGLSYYRPADGWAWAACVAVAAVLMSGVAERRPGRVVALVSAALLLPAVAIAPWPWRAGMLLAASGLATLWMAIVADVGASLAVTLNGMRLRRAGAR